MTCGHAHLAAILWVEGVPAAAIGGAVQSLIPISTADRWATRIHSSQAEQG